MSDILKKAEWYTLAIRTTPDDKIKGARMTKCNLGYWVRRDDPVIVAMARLCDAALAVVPPPPSFTEEARIDDEFNAARAALKSIQEAWG